MTPPGELVLAELRKSAGVTQAELALRLNRQQSHVSRVENAPLDTLTVRTLREYLVGIGADLTLGITARGQPPEATVETIGTP